AEADAMGSLGVLEHQIYCSLLVIIHMSSKHHTILFPMRALGRIAEYREIQFVVSPANVVYLHCTFERNSRYAAHYVQREGPPCYCHPGKPSLHWQYHD